MIMQPESKPTDLLVASELRLALECVASVLLIFGVVGTWPDGTTDGTAAEGWHGYLTSGMILLVGVVWACLTYSLASAAGAQPWLFRKDVDPDAADLPASLAARIARVREQGVNFDGKVWRTGPSMPELAPDGELPPNLRW